ncbi:uncharacterized protein LOC106008540 [Heterocephalus glaber]|uniref:Uncharacterized protein LOC106008540 n=1 Tax=Heterocephalus glaber TaxID=10181 RepID=A0AAX6S9Z0_HETGA|nr:uncharacterized protein LOC106008540 [Heterocephalus glaber]
MVAETGEWRSQHSQPQAEPRQGEGQGSSPRPPEGAAGCPGFQLKLLLVSGPHRVICHSRRTLRHRHVLSQAGDTRPWPTSCGCHKGPECVASERRGSFPHSPGVRLGTAGCGGLCTEGFATQISPSAVVLLGLICEGSQGNATEVTFGLTSISRRSGGPSGTACPFLEGQAHTRPRDRSPRPRLPSTQARGPASASVGAQRGESPEVWGPEQPGLDTFLGAGVQRWPRQGASGRGRGDVSIQPSSGHSQASGPQGHLWTPPSATPQAAVLGSRQPQRPAEGAAAGRADPGDRDAGKSGGQGRGGWDLVGFQGRCQSLRTAHCCCSSGARSPSLPPCYSLNNSTPLPSFPPQRSQGSPSLPSLGQLSSASAPS